MLKQWIKNSLFTVKNTLNNRAVEQKWWDNRPAYKVYMDQIVEQTNFLGSNTNMSERLYCILNDLSSKRTCICGNKTNFKSFSEGYAIYCTLECSYNDPARKEKIKSKLDYAKIHEKVKKTNLERYGTEHWFSSKNAVQKIKETKLTKYGDSAYCNIEKVKKTNLERYGVEYTGQAQSVIAKIQEAKSENIPELRDSEWLKKQNETKSLIEIAQDLNVTRRTVDLWFKKHGIEPVFFQPKRYKLQASLYDFICSALPNETVLSNDRKTIGPKELDILIPNRKIAIELNGLYWHAYDRKRHLEKTILCEERLIRLLQFWDHEWIEKREICESIILNVLGMCERRVYARKTEVKEITNEQYRDFLEENHLQGFVPAKIKLGLFLKNEMVSCMGIGKSRFAKESSALEIIRFCTKINTNVIGAFSKLLNSQDKTTYVSYCDRRLFDGKSYTKTGFTFSHTTSPGYFYYKKGMFLSRFQTQKHKLKNVIPDFNPAESEEKNMERNGWLKIWDCGNLVFTKS